MSEIPFTKMEVVSPDVIVATISQNPILMEISIFDHISSIRNTQEIIATPVEAIKAVISGFEPLQTNIQNMHIQFILSLVGEQGLQGTPGELKAAPVTTVEFNDLVANDGLIEYAAYFDIWTKHLHLATSTNTYRSLS